MRSWAWVVAVLGILGLAVLGPPASTRTTMAGRPEPTLAPTSSTMATSTTVGVVVDPHSHPPAAGSAPAVAPPAAPPPEVTVPPQQGWEASWFASGPDGDYAACQGTADGERCTAASGLALGQDVEVCHDAACVAVVVDDVCMGCHAHKLDLSLEAFRRLAPPAVGVIDISVAR